MIAFIGERNGITKTRTVKLKLLFDSPALVTSGHEEARKCFFELHLLCQHVCMRVSCIVQCNMLHLSSHIDGVTWTPAQANWHAGAWNMVLMLIVIFWC